MLLCVLHFRIYLLIPIYVCVMGYYSCYLLVSKPLRPRKNYFWFIKESIAAGHFSLPPQGRIRSLFFPMGAEMLSCYAACPCFEVI